MRIPKFEYFSPSSIEEVCALLSKFRHEAKLLAGGTDLFVKMKKKEVLPKYVISLKGIKNLDKIEWNEEGLKIGPLVTHSTIVNHPVIKNNFDFLSETCFKIGTRQVRNMGTLIGNLCNASPSSDAAPCLLVLDAKLKILSTNGERIVPIEDFFIGPFQTVLDSQEVLIEVFIPKPPPLSSGSYKYIHKASSVGETLAGVAIFLKMNPKNLICEDVKVGLSSVASTPIRAKMSEEFLVGKSLEESTIREAAEIASNETKPRSRPWYRREMVKVLFEEAILTTMEKIR